MLYILTTKQLLRTFFSGKQIPAKRGPEIEVHCQGEYQSYDIQVE